MKKNEIISNTFWFAIGTIVSRLLGFMRQLLMAHYLGTGAISDAFLTAFKIPNALRKIFAEGALSAVLVPLLVHLPDEKERDRLITIVTVTLTTAILCLCIAIGIGSSTVISFAAPGFDPLRHCLAAQFLPILAFYLLGISISAIFAAGLASKNRFKASSFGQAFLNSLFIIVLGIALTYHLSITTVCQLLVGCSLLMGIWHIASYMLAGGHFAWPTFNTLSLLLVLIGKFLIAFFAQSIVEINHFIDGQFMSYLTTGVPTLYTYAADFMRLPLGIIAVGFSSIMLPQFARITRRSPKRMPFMIIESCKFIIWFTLPIAFALMVYASDIFTTLYVSKNFSCQNAASTAQLLQLFLAGLTGFALNKMYITIFYALNNALAPTIISFVSSGINICLNAILMPQLGVYGLVIATVIAGYVQLMGSILTLYYYHHVIVNYKHLLVFLMKTIAQIIVCAGPFVLIEQLLREAIRNHFYAWGSFFTNGFGVWFWLAPWGLCAALTLFFTRKMFGINMHLL